MFARTRGYLPHIEVPSVTYMVTFRLYDSLPQPVISRYRQELEWQRRRKTLDPLILLNQYEMKIQKFLDGSYGHCWLRDPKIASLIVRILSKENNNWYVLHAYTVMPNHVHFLFSLKENKSLAKTIQFWKWSSSFYTNQVLERSGRFWQPEYFDTTIKSTRQFEFAARYIFRNPVKAGLYSEIHNWPWTRSSPEVQELIRSFFL